MSITQPWQPNTFIKAGTNVIVPINASNANGYHVCIQDHVTSNTPPLQNASSDNWHWIVYP